MKEQEKQNMHVKTGDTVIVVSGKDKGKIGKVSKVFPKHGKVLVEATGTRDEDKINLITRATKPSINSPKGGLVKKESPLHSSKVMMYDPSLKRGVRTSKKVLEDGSKVRVSKKSNEQFD